MTERTIALLAILVVMLGHISWPAALAFLEMER